MASTSQPIALPAAHSSYDYPMQEGSYTGSSGPFNPASYTRHFLGSPISWRMGSFGAGSLGAASFSPGSFGGRFPAGSPTAQLLSSIDPNELKYGKTPSGESGSLLNAFNVFDREGELCRNYTCCGLHLTDLHALLEHFEEVHIVVLDPAASQPNAHIQVPFHPQVHEISPAIAAAQIQHQQHQQRSSHPTPGSSQHSPPFRQQQQYAAPFDPDEMELDLDLDNSTQPPAPPSSSHSSPSSGAPSPPDTPISTPLSAYPSPHPFVPQSHLPLPNLHSPYISAPPSPLATTAASTRQSSPTSTSGGGGRPNLNLNLSSFPRSTLNSPSILTHPEDAFNAYARFSSDYSSCLPGAQYNGAAVDEAGVLQWQQQGQAGQQGQCVPPALLFSSSTSVTPASTPGGSRVPSPTSAAAAIGNSATGYAHPLSQTQSMPTTPISTAHPRINAPNPNQLTANPSPPNSASASSSQLPRPTPSLLLSKPFKCPKPNCNKSYKQANGLKYHMTHGSCNFAPPKDLEHVKDLLERKRREAGLTRSASLNDGSLSNAGGVQEKSYNYGELGNITETELREVEREAERRLRPFACGVGDCQRRYKNMNGLRYHYQHSGDHGAVGLALLASGQHECLGHGGKRGQQQQQGQGQQQGQQGLEDREGRKRSPGSLGFGLGSLGKGSVSVPVSRAGSTSRTGTPQPVAVPVTVHYSAPSSSAASNLGTTTTTPIHATPVQLNASTTPGQGQYHQQQLAYQYAQMQPRQYTPTNASSSALAAALGNPAPAAAPTTSTSSTLASALSPAPPASASSASASTSSTSLYPPSSASSTTPTTASSSSSAFSDAQAAVAQQQFADAQAAAQGNATQYQAQYAALYARHQQGGQGQGYSMDMSS